ncbi:MAG: glutathione S-transferase C-terminal domain-containing protein [bacterium]|nr:glutathione S-transferase C-terminal domain-containing protein [bacterium]
MHTLYGSTISYYAGKLEAYLRYRGHAYALLPHAPHEALIREGAGAVQSPVLRLEDGRWASDTTPILRWFETEYAETGTPSIFPEDPALRFVALLLEDHADEWLWRPAMHYRWSFLQDRDHASGHLVDEMLAGVPTPRDELRAMMVERQHGGFVLRDGVTDATRGHVEATAMASYDQLEAILEERPFLLGERRTIADFGFVGPMLRHFAQDPTPAELMRQRAPKLFTWVARMWEASPDPAGAALIQAIDAPLATLVREACETHMIQLRDNAKAFAAGASHFESTIQGCDYEQLPVSRYRVWCLEELRREWARLDDAAKETVRAHLTNEAHTLLSDAEPIARSDYDEANAAPFNRAINVYGDGVPG